MRNFIFFALAWLLLNMLQAGLTSLADDEAYYWLYAQHLDWGYFDHPPMVALFVTLGSWLPGELGVRLLSVFAQVAGLSVLYWGLLDEEDRAGEQLPLFFGLAFLIPIFQVFGFINTPDAPLLLFSVLFLFAYKKFLHRPHNLLSAVLLGITIAGLFYSKYHGILLVGFVVLSNLSLLLNPFLYLAGLVALALFSPHLLWQYENGFPSFLYHLVERNSSYEIKYSLEYLLNLLLVYNPFLWPLMAPMLIRPRFRGPFERSLFFIVIGFIGFFFISALRGHVQPQWTVVISYPLLYLLFRHLRQFPDKLFYLRKVALFVVPLLFIARLMLMIQYLPFRSEFYDKQQWAHEITEHAEGKPVIFQSSFQNASNYASYSDQKIVPSVRDVSYRKSQFDFWNLEQLYLGKPVFWVGGKNLRGKEFKVSTGQSYYGFPIPSYLPLNGIEITVLSPEKSLHPGQFDSLEIQISNPYDYPVELSDSGTYTLAGILFEDFYPKHQFNVEFSEVLLKGDAQQKLWIYFHFPQRTGEFKLGVAIQGYNVAQPTEPGPRIVVEERRRLNSK